MNQHAARRDDSRSSAEEADNTSPLPRDARHSEPGHQWTPAEQAIFERMVDLAKHARTNLDPCDFWSRCVLKHALHPWR